jgi:hypothetical protein
MLNKIILLSFFCVFSQTFFSQSADVQDTIYLLNGQFVGEKVLDTLLGAITIADPKKASRKIHYELDQLYMVRFANGQKRFYYQQDSSRSNWLTRDEMWMYMKGENDARRGFKARGALIGSGIVGLISGMTGSFFAPILPYGYMALSGIPKVKIRGKTISNPAYVESDAYILGYERVARQNRKIKSIIGGSVGLAVGFGLYLLFHNSYPETVDFGFKK